MRLFYLILAVFLTSGLCAQVVDDFTDGDFTADPTWSGDDGLFIIDGAQLRSNSPGASTYYLSTPSTLSLNANWEFFVNLKFGTSGANYIEVHLMADNLDLTLSNNGYFVKIGGVADEVVLYKKESGVDAGLISSAAGIVNSSSNNPFFIRVTRDASDLWTLLIDDGNLGSLISAGTITDNSINSSTSFGIKIEQSSAAGPINNHFFDDILVQEIVLDTTPPALSTITVLGSKQLLLIFDEDVDQISAETIGNYTVDSGVGAPVSAVLSLPNQVTLTFANDFSTGDYGLAISNIGDLNGNTLVSANGDFSVFVPDIPDLRDVIITELMADPSPVINLPESEFIELFNNSSKTFDLEDWVFSDATSSVLFPTYIFPPQSYLIVCPIASTSLFEPYGNVIGVSGFPSLNNGGDNLSIKDNTDKLIDQVNYLSSWYKDPDKQNGGFTLELIDKNNVCGAEENWIASNDVSGGTPGIENSVNNPNAGIELPAIAEVRALSPNFVEVQFSEPLDTTSIDLMDFQIDQGISIASVEISNTLAGLNLMTPITEGVTYTLEVSSILDCTGNEIASGSSASFILIVNPLVNLKDVIINEIMANPSEETSSPNAEFVEIFNRSDQIFNLQDWLITDGSTAGQLPYYLLYPDTYLILTRQIDAAKFDSESAVLGLSSFPTLNNSGDMLALYSESLSLVDTVNYDDSWYRSSIKDDGGYSLELIDPENICGEEENWIASEDESGATPGKPNSVLSELPDNSGPVLLNAIGISSDTVVLSFSEKLGESTILNAQLTLSNNLEVDHLYIYDLKTLHLILSTPIDSGVEYTVEISNVTDCPGNLISENFNSATFSLVELAELGDLLINEVLFNPRPNGVDFVEIYNNSPKFISLKNWKLANAKFQADTLAIGTIRAISTMDLIIGPAEYRAFLTDAIVLKDQYPKGTEANFVELSALPAYADEAGIVVLIDEQDSIFDLFEYNEDFHSPILSNNEGVSLERISFSQDTNDPHNWISAVSGVGFATPGYENSQRRGTIKSNSGSLTVDPKVIIPDGSGQNDFATISYSFNQSGNVANLVIMDINGREIKKIANNDFLGQEGFYTWDGSDQNGNPVRIGYYIVYMEVFDSNGAVQKFKEKIVIGSRF